uniref:SH2 domain-containing protein n=1 Tax=Romanomermis culicivorax TaxID=13658 RepID=A0A915JUX9_ROMCU
MVKSFRTEMDSAKSSVGFKVDDYYHKELRRQFVEDRLRADGDFLIRDNADCTQMVVSVMSRGNLCHFQALRRISNSGLTLFSFGDREFDRFEKLVEYHYRNQVPMSDPNRTLLKNPIRAPKLLYHEDEIEVRSK